MLERHDRNGAADRGEFLAAIASCLATATRQQERPDQVEAWLAAIAPALPGCQVDLAWRTQSCDGRLQYDALVALPDEGTFCLSFAPEDEQPWALLAAQRWSEGELLAVDDQRLRVNDATALVDILWKDQDISRRLINVCLLRRELARHPHVVTDEELSSYVEQWRRTKALFSARDFDSWLSRRGFTLSQFLSRAREQAGMVILRRRLVGDVSAQFEARRTEFDQVEYVRCRFGRREQAEQVKQAVVGGCEFWQLVDRRLIVPEFAVSRRRDLDAAQAEQLFAAAPDEVLGPFEGAQSFDLIRALGVRPAQLDGATRHALEDLLLEDWLARARSTARVEWNWGDVQG